MIRNLAGLDRWAERNFRLIVACMLILAAASFGPWVSVHLSHLWKREHYQFFPMLIVVLVGIAVSRRSSIPQLVPKDGRAVLGWKISIPFFLILLVSLAAAGWLNSPWFGTIGCVTLMLLVARNCGDLYPVVLPLLVLIPLPFALDTNLINWLQRVSSIGASALLDMADIKHLMSGNVLELPNRRLLVEEACSGIGSAFLMLASAALYAVWKRMRTIVAIPLLVSAVVWAVAGNTFRIFIVALSEAKHGPDLSHGLAHDLLGTATYCLSILMLVLTEQALLFVFEPIPKQLSDGSFIIKYGDSVRRSLIHHWNGLTSCEASFLKERANDRRVGGISMAPVAYIRTLLPILMIFSAITVFRFWPQSHSAASDLQTVEVLPAEGKAKLDAIPEDVFSISSAVPQVLECRTNTRRDAAELLQSGAHSKTWQLNLSGVEVSVALDGTFDSWHDVRPEFLNQGWKILRSEAIPSPGIGDESSVVTCTQFYRTDGDYLLLLFGEFRNTGAPIPVPPSTGLLNITKRFSEQRADTNQETWQFQMVVPHAQELDSATRKFWIQTYLEMFEIILDRWRSQP